MKTGQQEVGAGPHVTAGDHHRQSQPRPTGRLLAEGFVQSVFRLFDQAERFDAVADQTELIGQDSQFARDRLQLILRARRRPVAGGLLRQELLLLRFKCFLSSVQFGNFRV